MKMEGNGDLASLVKVTAIVTASVTYARYASASTRPGFLRLLALLPVAILLPVLPFSFSSIYLRTIFAFFLAWLGLFKLLLLSFGVGPLSPSLPLIPFIAASSLPVKIRPANSKPNSNLLIPFSIKLILLIPVISLYEYRPQFNRYLLLSVYCLHIYLTLEVVLGTAAFLAGALLGLDLEPQFDAPFKSRSLQEFWGRRWNLMVTGILRPSVYYPVRSRFGTAAGFMAVFLVSGLLHEVMFYYITLEGPTGEVTMFFLIHGLCTAAEVRARKAGWRGPPAVVAVPSTLGFVVATGFWLFFPQILRGGAEEKTIEESMAMMRLLKEGIGKVFRREIG